MMIPMLGLGKNSVSNSERLFAKAQADLAAAELAFSQAVKAMEDPPIELTDDQVGDLVRVKNLSEVRLMQARAGLRRAEHALDEARTAAAEKERNDTIARVHSLGASAQKIMTSALESATRELRRAMRAMAEAELAREELNAKLPEGQRIEPFEAAVMRVPFIPVKEISRRRSLMWINPFGGGPYSDEFTKFIHENDDGTALFQMPNQNTATLRRRGYFDRVCYTDSVPAAGDYPLAGVLNLPGLKGSAGWSALRYATPQSILAELDRLENAPTVTDQEGEIKTKLESVSPIFDSLEKLLAWEKSDRAQGDGEAA
jgi:hypothetical protein